MYRKFAVLCIVVFFFSGCITYRNFPEKYIGKIPAKDPDSMTYSMDVFTPFGGADRLKEVFRDNSPFKSAEKVLDKPATGTHIQVSVVPINPSLAAIGFGYLSLVTLTFLPAWSLNDGYEVYYEVYKNGAKVKTFSYEIRRKAFVWIVMVPFSWVNFLTYSEGDAFEATAYKFFADSKDYLK